MAQRQAPSVLKVSSSSEEGAELSEQGLQNLRTLTFGSLDAKAVADAFRKTGSHRNARDEVTKP